MKNLKHLGYNVLILYFIVWLLPVGNLFACRNVIIADTSEIAGKSNNGKRLTILFTNDIHSNANPRTLPYESHLVKDGDTVNIAGGYSRLATLIKKEREKAEKEGSALVLVDAGDMAMGTIFHSVYLDEAFELRTFARMGYDAYTFGNHDFDYGADGLARMIKCAYGKGDTSFCKFPYILSANLKPYKNSSLDTSFNIAGVRNSIIIERNGMKIGIMGLMGEHAYSVIAKKEGLDFCSPIEAAKREAEYLKSMGADFIIAVSHGGTLYGDGKLLDSTYIKGRKNRKYPIKTGSGRIAMDLADKELIYANSKLREKSQDGRIAMEIPLIDVIISGHDHEYLYTPFIINNTVIGSSGGYNCMLGKMVLEKGVLISYELLPITRDITPDTAIQSWIDTIAHKINDIFYGDYGISPFDTIGVINRDYDATLDRAGNMDLGLLIAKSYRYAALKYVPGLDGTNLVTIVPAGVIRNTLAKGYVTYNDVFNVLSLGKASDGKAGYPLVLAWIYGEELIDVCEMVATVAPRMEDVRLFFNGLEFTYNRYRIPFTRVTGVKINGIPVVKNKLYPVVTGMYTAMLIGLLKSESYSLLSAIPKDEHGVPIDDFNKHIIGRKTDNGEYTEVSEWMALAGFIRENAGGGDNVVLDKSAVDASALLVYIKYVIILILICGVAYIGIRKFRKNVCKINTL